MKMLRLPEVVEATGLSRPTIYRLEAKGEFPKRRRLGRNSIGWIEEEIHAWIQARPMADPRRSGLSSFARLPPP